MIAGGSGITPMYQIIQAVVTNNNDRTQLVLLFANKTEVILRIQLLLVRYFVAQRIISLCLIKKVNFAYNFGQCKLQPLIYNQPPPSWVGFSGFVTKEMTE